MVLVYNIQAEGISTASLSSAKGMASTLNVKTINVLNVISEMRIIG